MAISSTSGTLSSPGIGSNLDVNGIVTKLMAVEQQPLLQLNKKQASYQAQISAYGSVTGALSSFQSALQALSSASSFQSVTATPTDSTILSASAGSTAAPGSYTLSVSKLAQAQSLLAAGQTSETASIGTGATTTLSFDFGTIAGGTLTNGVYTGATFTSNGGGVKTVTIDSTNNSLAGIRDAINAANIGVSATIVNDGSASPYRLVLTSTATGQTNSMSISVSGDPTLGTLLSNNPAGAQHLTETSTAQNAAFTVNGVSISKASNTVTDAITGVTLNLLKTTTSPTTLTVARDTASVQSSVQAFVKAYNDLNTALKSVSSYDATTQKSAILQGDSTILMLQSKLRSMLTQPLGNTFNSITTLSQIGVSFQRDGSLAVDSTKLSAAITNHFSEIATLFASTGSASDSLVNYVSSTNSTKPGSYALNVTQIATQGTLVGSAAPTSTTITAGVNDTLNVSVDGTSTTITLAAGTYTAASLAAELQAKINGDSAITAAGRSVTVTQAGGPFTITSAAYGSSSSVAITGGNGLTNLFGTPTSTVGVDVAGTIDGQAATGVGQYLTGSGNADGLKIQVTGGALGSRGIVSYTQGYATTLSNYATSMLASDGPLQNRTKGINSSITNITNQVAALNSRLTTIQANYMAQFSRLDTMLSSMQSTSSYLTQQLASLQNLKA